MRRRAPAAFLRAVPALLALASASACGDGPEVRTTRYADGSPWSEVTFEGDVPHGPARTWHPGGVLASAGAYRDGAAHGPWRYWRPDGTLEIACSYDRDVYHGEWTRFHEDGETVAERVRYEHGVRDAEWVRNDPEGRPIGRGTYDRGRKNGVWRTFYSGGVESARETWDRGVKTGETRGFYPDGSPAFAGETLDGKPVGTWQRWHPNGQLAMEGTFTEESERTGRWTVRRPDGELDPERSGIYEDGVKVAEWD